VFLEQVRQAVQLLILDFLRSYDEIQIIKY